MLKKPKILKTVLIIIIIIITASVTVVATLFFVNAYLKNLPIPVDNLMRVASLIDEYYYDDYDSSKIEENMLGAVVDGLGDKYSVYYNEKNAKEQVMEIDGYYVGIGVEAYANSESKKIEVISAYEESPAYKAGVRSGDYIVRIDGKDYDANSFPEAVIHMKGVNENNPLEKELRLTLERDGELIEVSLKRKKIQMNKVKSEIIEDICYIRYPGFDELSLKEVKKIVNNLDDTVKGIVIDVRNNPGGEFKSSIDMCDLFLDDVPIMYTVDKSGRKTVYKAKKGKCDLPLAVLINRASASASEIFAGALQSNGRAVIVGEKSFGKGVSQTVRYINPHDFSAGAVKLTICRNYTPDGRWINESVIPDIPMETEMSTEIKNDAAFKTAVESIKGKSK